IGGVMRTTAAVAGATLIYLNTEIPVGAAEGAIFWFLFFRSKIKKIAACGSSYRGLHDGGD
ncbi:hypothetical protein, partial [Pseudomonas sp. MD195_PC81_125]|uniref:hypothetical protein n=1 Tax=Pseudomonas sp. MD195_PC81_125 TaxID=2741560 RepID=UPI001C713E16